MIGSSDLLSPETARVARRLNVSRDGAVLREIAALAGVEVRQILCPMRDPDLRRLRDLVVWECRRAGLSHARIAAVIGREKSAVGDALRRERERRAADLPVEPGEGWVDVTTWDDDGKRLLGPEGLRLVARRGAA